MRSHHEQGAMCQIDDVEDPEDKGQARGDQKQQYADLNPVQQLN
jgi:hypothetical protein